MIERIQQAHALYCRLTGQRVSLRFDRERLWYELFHAGFNETDLQKPGQRYRIQGRLQKLLVTPVQFYRYVLVTSCDCRCETLTTFSQRPASSFRKGRKTEYSKKG